MNEEVKVNSFIEDLSNDQYYQNEQWFKVGDVVGQIGDKLAVSGIKLVNSYGRVRVVFLNGKYVDLGCGNNATDSDWAKDLIIKDLPTN